MDTYFHSLIEGIKSLKISPFQTFFSTLGIVIGVAALASILALGDGLEKYARDQVSETTSVLNFEILTKNIELRDGLRLRNPNAPIFTLDDKKSLEALVDTSNKLLFNAKLTTLLTDSINNWELPVRAIGVESENDPRFQKLKFTYGKIDADHFNSEKNSIWINKNVLNDLKLFNKDTTQLNIFGINRDIVGVIDDSTSNIVWIPAQAFTDSILRLAMPSMLVKAGSIEQVDSVKKTLYEWAQNKYSNYSRSIYIQSHEFRLKQLSQGLLIFKIVMGMITGLSVLVGGIGVMNVLMMSVKERTAEIGIRKATGAKRLHIVLQFLSESISISLFGSVIGLIISALFMEISLPIVRSYTEIQLHTAWTFDTLSIISIIAVLVGVTFGTFPAWKASRLDPIVAIQRV